MQINQAGQQSQFSLVPQSHLTLCNPIDCHTPGFSVHHELLELAQTHVHRVGDATQPSHPLLSIHNSKWIKDLNVRAKIIKLLQENIGSMHFDFSFSNIFFGYATSRKGNKSKNKQMGLQQRCFCTAKETTNKMKRQHISNERRHFQTVYILS